MIFTVEQELRQTIAQLELVSHVSAVSMDSSGRDTSDDIGGKRPPGGVRRGDERKDGIYEVEKGVFEEMVFLLKGADHFRRRMMAAHTERALELILADAKRSLAAWKHQAPSADPPWGSFEWKRQIAREVESGQRSPENARTFYSVSARTIRRYVDNYGVTRL